MVRSADGTQIAWQREGSGPAVVLVGGGLDDGSENAVLMPALAGEFTVYNYARRGRGGSGDTQPYVVQRELEDLAAVLDAAGGKAHVFGASSGGALALEAAAAGLPIARLAVYDVPYSVAEDAVERWRAYRAELDEALAQGRMEGALAAFMRLGGASGMTSRVCGRRHFGTDCSRSHRRSRTTRPSSATTGLPRTASQPFVKRRWCSRGPPPTLTCQRSRSSSSRPQRTRWRRRCRT